MDSETLPSRIHNAYLFQAFNAVSWQICLGSPLILFARELGAPAVVLGTLALFFLLACLGYDPQRGFGKSARRANA